MDKLIDIHEEDLEEYVRGICPVCFSNGHLEMEGFRKNDPEAFDVTCTNCGTEFVEIFSITNVQIVKDTLPAVLEKAEPIWNVMQLSDFEGARVNCKNHPDQAAACFVVESMQFLCLECRRVMADHALFECLEIYEIEELPKLLYGIGENHV